MHSYIGFKKKDFPVFKGIVKFDYVIFTRTLISDVYNWQACVEKMVTDALIHAGIIEEDNCDGREISFEAKKDPLFLSNSYGSQKSKKKNWEAKGRNKKISALSLGFE